MEAMIALGVVMVVVFGGMGLALVSGYLSAEKARAARGSASRGQMTRVPQAIPGFFVMPGRAEWPLDMPAVDEALLARLETHVREEQALVSEFVLHPSIKSLYRQGPQALRLN